MDYVTILILALVGLCIGSFAGASVWRLRARQLVRDKKDGEKVDKAEYKRLVPLTKSTLLHDRSRCLHCGYELRWYDLLPLASWLTLGGKCRRCRRPIGKFEPLIELSVAVFFVASYILWPFDLVSGLEIARFVLWLMSGVILAILFSYDLKWFLLPDSMSLILAILGGATSVVVIIGSDSPVSALVSVVTSVGILAGIYGLLYITSKGKWIGFGDVKLGIGLGLLLADWRLALVAFFAANLLGTLIVLPGLLTGKLKAGTRIPFGPLLIGGMVLALLFGGAVVDWYSASLLL